MQAPNAPKLLTMPTQPLVYVSNLPYEATRSAVEEVFGDEGIEPARIEFILKGQDNRKRNSGLATVTLKSVEDAVKACKVVDGKPVFGRPMIIRANRFVEDVSDYKHSDYETLQ